jgi:membrane fusion protein, multidrug efflux system
MKTIIKAIATVFIILASISCNEKNVHTGNIVTQESIKPIFKTVQPTTVIYADEITAVGLLSNKNEYQLSFMVGGIVNSVGVEEGEYVRKGQVLAQINQIAVEVMVKQLELVYEKSQRDYNRLETLYQDSVVTLEQLQNAQTGLDNAKLELENALFRKEYSTIKAPSSGKIQKIIVRENEMTSAGNPILVLGSDVDGKVLKTSIADVDIVKIKMKDHCTISFDAFPNKIFTGYISEISGVADKYTGTYEIEINVKDKKNVLKSGFIGKALIKTTQENEYKQIPIEALISANKMTGEINILEEGKKKLRTVKIARILGDQLLISDGLSGKEQIIIN